MPARSIETLRLAALSVRIDDVTLDVSAEAWRSFQPIAGKNTQPLIAQIRVRATGGPLPPSLATDGIYLVHGGDVFPAFAREEEERADGARFAEFTVRDGPKWPVGDSIDVIVAFKATSATTYLLRAPKTVITRVD
ncbi:MAG: hypothetical protein ABIT38_17830 [Gemmatimonadaceae bacterium]